MIALVPIVIAIAGALLYALAGNAKLAELGRLSFGAAMIAISLHYLGQTISLR